MGRPRAVSKASILLASIDIFGSDQGIAGIEYLVLVLVSRQLKFSAITVPKSHSSQPCDFDTQVPVNQPKVVLKSNYHSGPLRDYDLTKENYQYMTTPYTLT